MNDEKQLRQTLQKGNAYRLKITEDKLAYTTDEIENDEEVLKMCGMIA
jgi:hypothetical protein